MLPRRIMLMCCFVCFAFLGCEGCESRNYLRRVDGEYRTARVGAGELANYLVVGEEVDFEFGTPDDGGNFFPVAMDSAGSTDESVVMISKIVYGVDDAEFTTVTLEARGPGQATVWVEAAEETWEQQFVVVATEEELPEELREAEDAGGGAAGTSADGA